MSGTTFTAIDPVLMEKYFKGATFPLTYDELMQIVRGNDAPQEVIEQLEQMLRSDTFNSLEQLENEVAGFYNDGEAVAMDGDLS